MKIMHFLENGYVNTELTKTVKQSHHNTRTLNKSILAIFQDINSALHPSRVGK